MLDSERKRSAGYAFLEFKESQTAKMFVEQVAKNMGTISSNPFVVEFALQDSRKLKKLKNKNWFYLNPLHITLASVLLSVQSMSETVEPEEIQITGTLLNITVFEDKIMKNFLLISNKLRRLETVFDMEQKQKALEKELKFLTMKV